MFKIYAISAEFNANDEATVEALMDTRPVRRALASNVRSNSDFIVARKDDTPVDDILNLNIKIVDRSYTMANSDDARESVQNVINAWAQKSRVVGVRGDRLAVVSELEQTEFTDDNDNYDVFEVNVNLGTAVFYNNRRVTVNFPANQREFAQDLTNLFEHLTKVGAVDTNTGVIVSSDVFGEFHTGNTNLDVEDEYDNSVSDDEIGETLSNIACTLDDIDDEDDRDTIRSYLQDVIDQAQSLLNELDERG